MVLDTCVIVYCMGSHVSVHLSVSPSLGRHEPSSVLERFSSQLYYDADVHHPRRPACAFRSCLRIHARCVCTDMDIRMCRVCRRCRCTGRTSSRRASPWMLAPARRSPSWVPREAESPPAYSFYSGELLLLRWCWCWCWRRSSSTRRTCIFSVL